MHPADRHGPVAGEARGSSPTSAALRPDLEALDRQPDGGRPLRAHHRRRRQRRRAVGLRATGQVVTFDGFLKVYLEGRDDEEIDSRRRRRRPPAADRERRAGGKARGHARSSTSPSRRRATPRRRWSSAWRSSASAGPRPTPRSSRRSRSANTSARSKNRLIPEDKGRLVTAFLANYFGRYVDYDFTADLEEDLDRVTTGDEDWKALLGAVLEAISPPRSARPKGFASPR